MNFSSLAKRAGKLLADNSPMIMTAIGVTGTLSTAYLAGKASYEASQVIENERTSRLMRKDPVTKKPVDPPLEFKDMAELTWKLYVPAAGSAVMTIACIVCANRIGTRRAAALATAYSLSEKAWGEYKDKVVDKLGATREQKVHDEIAQDHVTKNPPVDKQIVITGDGEVLCHEALTGRYFKSTVQKIKAAQNEINAEVIHDSCASLSEFYDLVGLPRTSMSDEFGWNTDTLMEINWSTTLSDKEEPCISFTFNKTPIRDFHRYS